MSRNHFRVRVLVLAMALTFAAAPGARAQDSLQIAGVGPAGQVHVVQLGETLWELARLYMGDPLLWPEIYRINTMVVEDPHWIFPGEELMLVQPDATVALAPPPAPVADTTQAVDRPVDQPVDQPLDTTLVEMPDAPPPPPPVTENSPTVFAQGAAQQRRPLAGGPSESYRAVRRGDFYAAGFLTEGDALPWGAVLGNMEPGSAGGPFGTSTAMLHGRIAIEAPAGATYHVGDTVLTAQLGRDVPRWGKVVRPTGLARVTHASGRTVEAEVIMQFSRVSSDQVAMPVEPFRNPGSTRPAAVSEGLSGAVITVRDRHPVPNQQNIVFIDRGRQDGIVPGDIFEIVRPEGESLVADRPPDRVALLHIVHVRERSASGMVFQIVRPGVVEGAPVRLVAKMPS